MTEQITDMQRNKSNDSGKSAGLIIMLLAIAIAAVINPASKACAEGLSPSGFIRPSGGLAVMKPSEPMQYLSSAGAEDLNRKMENYNEAETDLLKNSASSFYYYNMINPVAKQIYDVIYQVARDPVNEGNIGLMMTDIDPESDEYYDAFNIAYRSICFDHPELFWLYSGEEARMLYWSDAINQNGFYFVYIAMEKPFEGFQEQMMAFNSAVDEFLSGIDTSISEYSTICQIHDRLIDLVNYNDPVAGNLFISFNGQDLAHTAYGALVCDSSGNPNYAVCDGYSLAFEYLLQQCGIEAVFVCGKAGSSPEDAGGHAWNMVKMDGEWYEVDSTWDDSGSFEDDLTPGTDVYANVLEALSDPDYRQLIDHFLFLISTETMQHFVPGDEYQYTTKNGMVSFSLVDEVVHIRRGEMGEEPSYDGEIMSQAPVAMNSYRTWDMP